MSGAERSNAAERLVGEYEIIRPIGRGGIAVVYLARQPRLERAVALKELNSFQAESSDMAERFVRESRIAGSLNHPNVATVFDFFEHEGVPYIAMEYLQHGSLRPYVGRLSLAQFVGVMEGVLAGLAHAHASGIVHRDLKPENLLVTDEGRVKITDFGIAKATQTARAGAFITTTGTTVGTPTYMAPEQAMAQELGPWTDLYSVGVMAWEHTVGRVPFHDAEAPIAVVLGHIKEPIAPAVEVNPATDPEVSHWIDRLLMKEPKARPQSPAAAWDELEEIAIRRLGPKWRSEARLSVASRTLDTSEPLTPAPFQSQHGPKVVTDADESAGSVPGYITFSETPRRTPPAAGASASLEPREEEVSAVPPAPGDGSSTPPLQKPSEISLPETAEEQLTLPPVRVPPVKVPAGDGRWVPRPRRRGAALAAVAAIAGTAAFVATHVTRSPASAAPHASTVASNALSVLISQDWQRGPARSLPNFNPASEVVVRPRISLDKLLVLGTARTTDATLLPEGLVGALPQHTASGQVVELGRFRFYRYLNLTSTASSQVATIYTLPTTAGTVIAVCGASASDASFTAMCERVIGTLRVTSGRALALGPSSTYGTALKAAIIDLNNATRAARVNMRNARTAAAQADAARQLAAAYQHASMALSKVDPGPQQAGADARLTHALTTLANGYGHLARAATAQHAGAYGVARASIARADASLTSSLTELARFGYESPGDTASR